MAAGGLIMHLADAARTYRRQYGPAEREQWLQRATAGAQ